MAETALPAIDNAFSGTQATGQALCRVCGTGFAQKRSWQSFCSDRCRNAFHQTAARLAAIRDASPKLYEALRVIAEGDATPAKTARAAIGDLKAP